MSDMERRLLLEEQARREERSRAILESAGRMLERLALLLTGAGIVSVLLAIKGVDSDLLTGAAVSFMLAAICAAAGRWIGDMGDV